MNKFFSEALIVLNRMFKSILLIGLVVWHSLCQLCGLIFVTMLSIFVYAKFAIESWSDDKQAFAYSDVVRHVERHLLTINLAVKRIVHFDPSSAADRDTDNQRLESELMSQEVNFGQTASHRFNGEQMEKPF